MALFISVSNAAECKKFICQTFEAGPNDVCVLINETATDELVRNCDKEKTCNATGWITPESAIENATCTNASDPIVNLTLPGDICTESSECFSAAASNATCSGGICTTTAEIGTNCTVDPDDLDAGTKSCPAGAYCDADLGNCTKQLGKGEECSGFDQCTTGFACLKITGPSENATTTYNCTDYWSLDVGIQFDATYVTRTGNLLTLNDTCKTHHTITTGTANVYECRTAPVGNYSTEAELERPDGPSDDCGYTTFDDPANTTEGTAANDTAKCGFNKGGSAYCNKRKGDSWFQGVFDVVKGLDISALQCHALSPLSTCLAAVNAIGADNYKAWVQELLAVDENHGYGLYADNDDCVKNSITNEFWQTNPDSAFGSLTLSSFAAMILTISALFYMF